MSECEREPECVSASCTIFCACQDLYFEVHKVLRLPRTLHFEVHQTLPLPRNLHSEVHKALCLPRNLHTSHMSKSQVKIHRTCLKSKYLKDHHHVQSAAPATISHFEVKPLRSLVVQNTRFPLRLPRKVTAMSENARGSTTRAQSREAPAPAKYCK